MGLGALFLQANSPVTFASKPQSETESRYSNIERKMLAVLFGLEKFRYAYDRLVVVESDHKPLAAIFKKYLASAPPCIARMMLRILKYDLHKLSTSLERTYPLLAPFQGSVPAMMKLCKA